MVSLKKMPGCGELFYGAQPNLEVLEKLEEEKFDCIWNLASDTAAIAHIERKYVPTVILGEIDDFSVPSDSGTFIAQLDKIVRMLRGGSKVFIHCAFGIGRTSLVLACIRVMFGDSAKSALSRAVAAAGGVESKHQADFVVKLEQAVKY